MKLPPDPLEYEARREGTRSSTFFRMTIGPLTPAICAACCALFGHLMIAGRGQMRPGQAAWSAALMVFAVVFGGSTLHLISRRSADVSPTSAALACAVLLLAAFLLLTGLVSLVSQYRHW